LRSSLEWPILLTSVFTVAEKWKPFKYFNSVPDDSQPLRRCMNNLEFMDAITNVENLVHVVLWLAILWLKCKELIPQVQEQLGMVTKEATQGRRMDLKLMGAKDVLSAICGLLTRPPSLRGQRSMTSSRSGFYCSLSRGVSHHLVLIMLMASTLSFVSLYGCAIVPPLFVALLHGQSLHNYWLDS